MDLKSTKAHWIFGSIIRWAFFVQSFPSLLADEKTLRDAFAEDKGVISSKKTSFSGELQIERKDSDGDYCDDNCEFACVICNNAKSDMISAEEFKAFFVPGIQEYWKYIKEKLR